MDEKIHRVCENIDVVDFVEKILGIKLFWYQKNNFAINVSRIVSHKNGIARIR